ncbi:AAA family ATPase [Peribacillus tepidiphilus]|uniref:AAA family ATPase n=1 Tax=Peribacillus tepidiphilus TaxID=2652445 RepID=UPI001291A69E|nr:AAA family ATPase [Peribacillus tepidiphilus]
MRILEIFIKNYRSIGEDEVKIDFSSSNILFLIGQNSVGKSNILNTYELFWNTSKHVDTYDFHWTKKDNPIEIEATVEVYTEDFKCWCYKENKLKIKQKIYPDNTRDFLYWSKEENKFKKFPTATAKYFISQLPMPVRIPGLEQIGNTTNAVSELLHAIFKKGIGLSLQFNQEPNDVVRESPVMKSLEEKLNISISNVFKGVFYPIWTLIKM